MHLSNEQLASFEDQDFLVLPNLFSSDEVKEIKDVMGELFSENNPGNIREPKGGQVRTAIGLHLRHDVFAGLVRDPRLVEPAYQLRGNSFMSNR